MGVGGRGAVIIHFGMHIDKQWENFPSQTGIHILGEVQGNRQITRQSIARRSSDLSRSSPPSPKF